jgi:hypothetical protein
MYIILGVNMLRGMFIAGMVMLLLLGAVGGYDES